MTDQSYIVTLTPKPFSIRLLYNYFVAGLAKIDCNRYSIAIFFTFCLSNALEPLLF